LPGADPKSWNLAQQKITKAGSFSWRTTPPAEMQEN